MSSIIGPSSAKADAGAVFVLQSRGTWYHAGYHLTTAIVGPTILTLPYVFRGLGWVLGFACVTAVVIVSFYSYYLMSLVLQHCESSGNRHIRFRDLAADILGDSLFPYHPATEFFYPGSGWMFYFVIFLQGVISVGAGVITILLSGESIQILYSNLSPDGAWKLYDFIAIVTAVMVVAAQLPSFHSLRYLNFASLLLCLGYTFITVGACVYAGLSDSPPARDFSLESSTSERTFNAFSSISITAAIIGCSIVPEIQATLEPPTTGKLLKGLMMCYGVIAVTFYPIAISGYWVFGNQASSNILQSLLPEDGPSWAPTWILGLAIIFVIFQLLAICLVYSQVAYEVMEKKSADASKGVFSKRNLVPRLFLRSAYVLMCGLIAAMLPFFGDINGVIGAVGFIPLDFILPMLLYNMALKPRKRSAVYCVNALIMICFTGVGILGSFSTIRQLVLDAKTFKLFSADVEN